MFVIMAHKEHIGSLVYAVSRVNLWEQVLFHVICIRLTIHRADDAINEKTLNAGVRCARQILASSIENALIQI